MKHIVLGNGSFSYGFVDVLHDFANCSHSRPISVVIGRDICTYLTGWHDRPARNLAIPACYPSNDDEDLRRTMLQACGASSLEYSTD